LPPLQKLYLLPYLRTEILPFHQNFHLVQVGSAHGPMLAVDPWVQVQGTGKQKRFVVTSEGRQAGVSAPVWPEYSNLFRWALA